MGTSKIKRWLIHQVYDALTGEFIRDIRSNDIVSLSAAIKSGTGVASTIGMTSYVMYPYIFRAETQSTQDSLALLKNGSTIAILGAGAGAGGTGGGILPQIIVDPDRNPLCMVAAGDTIKITPIDAASGTYNATLIMKRVPVNTKVNTG
ncbi:hypothetical protein LCGC14_1171700 [marine sediment metagenome]|uniref:Uncharacterized protein n=1 Tax=marine sediment metagenome TaxID=412755 RepID=A0A0F9LPN5_9ZZZZ